VWTSVGTRVAGFHSYAAQQDGSFRIVLTGCTDSPLCEEERSDADITATGSENRISVSPLTWDRTYGYPIDGQRELSKVQKFVEHDAPRP
jgi:5'-nucleotidase